ncbi:MAG TPA: hypothetical protein VGK56_18050, partial [Anaerolineales bacterium]
LTLISAPSGYGKTRLALQPGGLPTSLSLRQSEESLVPCAPASGRAISEEPGRTRIETLADALEPGTMLGVRQ